MSRILYEKENKVSQRYKKGVHDGIDIIGDNGQPNKSGLLDNIVAHSHGIVVSVRSDYKTSDKTGHSYGNYVKIQHENGMYTLYAHLKYGSVTVSKGSQVIQGEIIGFMGNTGHCNGAHVHFEVRNKDNVRIDPTPYIDSDLPNLDSKQPTNELSESELLLLVKQTIRGDYGSGEERREALGDNFSIVQNQVNLNYKYGTTRWDNVRLY